MKLSPQWDVHMRDIQERFAHPSPIFVEYLLSSKSYARCLECIVNKTEKAKEQIPISGATSKVKEKICNKVPTVYSIIC